ncbi:MAG: long-chain fatty acid--CoA ligase [Deltaproteobacteria bacterium]|nr:long-chain fatty acid--CoA ligase [Deltaproteobacteria bacterium]
MVEVVLPRGTPAAFGCATLCAAFQETVAAQGDVVALRTKGDRVRMTWREYGARVRALAAGFAGVGVGPGDTVGIVMCNRPEFNCVDAAVMHLGAAPFSMYVTSSPEQFAYFVRDSGTRVIVTERAQLARLRAMALRVEIFVCVDGDAEGALSLHQLEARARADFDFEAAWRAVRPETLLTITYTSGTTGDPKGVEITHANMVAEARAFQAVRQIEPGSRVISYLPHAHVADRFGTHYLPMFGGASVTACPDPRLLFEHAVEVRPTEFTGVPRVWEKLKAGIEAKLAAEPEEAKRKIVGAAIDAALQKVRLEQAGQAVPEALAAGVARADAMVFGPLRAAVGLDQARSFFVGAAPSTRDVLEFFHAIGVAICEVWGMSELSCVATSMPLGVNRIGTVGTALPGVELRLAEDGELLVRGPVVMRGYRNKPEQTRETIDREGWLHTGDVATIDREGFVTIVDRKKELIISAGGKNMSPANIEARIKASSPLIGQAAVVGDRRPYNVALLVLDPDGAMAFCKARGIDAPLAQLVEHAAVLDAVGAAIEGANGQLSRVEQVKCWTLLAAEWLPGGDELTPTMKLKRKAITAKYADVIASMYES